MHFGLDSYNFMLKAIGFEDHTIELSLRFLLPLGISFYTFQSMSYTIDVYRKDAKPVTNFLDFACYVSMFPQLVAGPIIRFQEVALQLVQRTHSMEKFVRGVAFFSLGMAKKVYLANSCGKIADITFGTGALKWYDAWYGVVAYAFQIYFDFSGYSDMAIGLGLMFGFVFPKNFDSPYISASITEFWQRWHISLSTWLKQYLYIPLGGNRKGQNRTAINLLIVMFLGGLWHGASWKFVVWGLIHGFLLGFERLLGKRPLYSGLPRPFRVVFTFGLVLIAWVFFRADTMGQALVYIGSLFNVIEVPESSLLVGGLIYKPYYLLAMLICSVIVWKAPQTWDWTRRITPMKALVTAMVFLCSVTLLTLQSYNPFIYFNF
jgi:alginate O-acetyltransferase complex protein AlgI